MICAVSILSKMAAERLRQATLFKISNHIVKVQKIRSGCIFLNIAPRASTFYNTGGSHKPDEEWKNLRHDCNMVMKAKV